MKRYNLKYLLIILIVSVTMTGPAVVFAESPAGLVEKGNAAYNAGNYDEALSAYDQAAKEMPADAWIEFNKGAAFFRKGDLDKAKDAWEKAALGATEIPLEAESLYNLGTLEFSKVTQTQAADPEAALEAGDRSVRYYHQAKDLLDNSPKDRNNPLIQEASENIELVRRTMKSIQDLLARQQEMAQNQKQAAEDLKNLIDQQSDLNTRAQSQAEASQPPEADKQGADPLKEMAEEQDRLREQTRKTAEKLSGPDQDPKPDSDPSDKSNQAGQAPDPAQAAKDHLNQAQDRQAAAADNLNAGQAPGAVENQKAALEEMKTALDLLKYKDNQNKDSQNKSDQDKNGQSKDSQKPQGSQSNQTQPQADQTQQQGQPEQKQDARTQPQMARQADLQNKDDQPESASPVVLMPDDAERILGEEKENKKIRRQVGSGGYQDVDKDW
ncbi:MAG: tetratricopeptide repeat protein [Desulfosalsimonadaceae bacterium]|nr:tetratricopeptide repeat protein [Desulfosalsimonadaceae bacterium]